MGLTRRERVTARRGGALRCRGWRQEAILRMLENTLELAESPEELVVYAGNCVAARDWASYDRIVEALLTMSEDETLVVQSGRPVGVFRTHRSSPIVLMANGLLAGPSATSEGMQQLVDAGQTIFPGMTAAAWQYIGSQGILQGTYETFMTVARQRFGGTLAGRLVVSAGLGGMGGAQPLAGVMAGAATLVADVDGERIDRRIDEGYLQRRSDDVGEALELCLRARDAREPISVGVRANVVDVLQELLERRVTPDVVTDQTTTDLVQGYVPHGLDPSETAELRRTDRAQLVARNRQTIAMHMRGILELGRRGAEIFEYGNGLRQQALDAGVEDAFTMDGFIERYIRPLFFHGIGPFRWVAISGDPDDIRTVDALILDRFAGAPICDWIAQASEHVRFTGLPARIGWLGYGDRRKLGLLVNEAVADGALQGPVAFTRDHLDSGSVTNPYRETEHMRDGSDGIADWPVLNGLLAAASNADLVAVHGNAGQNMSAGATTVADGTSEAAARLLAVLDNDPALGILRHASAGYDDAVAAAEQHGIGR